MLIGSPMGAGGFVTPRRPLPRPHGGHLRPARRRAQPAHRRRDRAIHARSARRRPASPDRRARRRTGRPVRQQRRRGQRARARGAAPGGRPDARRARAAGRPACCRTARRRWPPHVDVHETYLRERLRPGDGEVHRAGQLQGPDPGRLRRPARPRPAHVRAARPRTTAAATTRSSARTSSRAPLRARLRRAPRGLDAHRHRCRHRESEGSSPHRGGDGVAERLGHARPSSSRATTTASSAASTAQQGDPDGFAAKLREVLATKDPVG